MCFYTLCAFVSGKKILSAITLKSILWELQCTQSPTKVVLDKDHFIYFFTSDREAKISRLTSSFRINMWAWRCVWVSEWLYGGGGGWSGGGVVGGFVFVYVIGLNDPRPRLDLKKKKALRVRQTTAKERQAGNEREREDKNKAVKHLDTYTVFMLIINIITHCSPFTPFPLVLFSTRFLRVCWDGGVGNTLHRGFMRWNQNYS